MTRARKTAHGVALIAMLAALTVSPAVAQRSTEAKRIGSRMMCLCGCNQVLTECNHVGCTVSDEMLKKLDQRVALGEPEDLTLQSFVQEYGQRVLADPPAKGFNRLAVIMPIAALSLGGLMLYAVLMKMRRPQTAVAGAPAAPRVSNEELERWRRQADEETE